jgi:type 1 fimbria pilin
MPMAMTARFKADAAPVTPVEPGQVSASVTLTVQYALEK